MVNVVANEFDLISFLSSLVVQLYSRYFHGSDLQRLADLDLGQLPGHGQRRHVTAL